MSVFFMIIAGIVVLLVVGGALALLYYSLTVTQDHRKRRAFSEATAHLTPAELEAGLHSNMGILAQAVQCKTKGADAQQKAEAALIMATVLREHIARQAGEDPLPTYLKARRAVLKEAKTYPLG